MAQQKQNPETEKMVSNFETLTQLVSKISDESVRDSLGTMLRENQTRIMTAPNSTKVEFPGAYNGGLVSVSLQILKLMIKMNEALSLNIKKDDLIIVGLFHNLGKIGSNKQDYYCVQTSSWHRENLGQMFKLNDDIDDNLTPHIRSLQILNNAGVCLSSDAFSAIVSLSNLTGEQPASSTEIYKAPDLVTIFQAAFKLTTADASRNIKKSVLD